jgi:hypothetical protein
MRLLSSLHVLHAGHIQLCTGHQAQMSTRGHWAELALVPIMGPLLSCEKRQSVFSMLSTFWCRGSRRRIESSWHSSKHFTVSFSRNVHVAMVPPLDRGDGVLELLTSAITEICTQRK